MPQHETLRFLSQSSGQGHELSFATREFGDRTKRKMSRTDRFQRGQCFFVVCLIFKLEPRRMRRSSRQHDFKSREGENHEWFLSPPLRRIEGALQTGLLTSDRAPYSPCLPVPKRTVAAIYRFRCRLQLRGQWRILTALPAHLEHIRMIKEIPLRKQ